MNRNIYNYSSRNFSGTHADLSSRLLPPADQGIVEALKTNLVQRLSSEFSDVETHLVRQAVNEAHSLASLTAVPQLVFLTLAEEKVQNLRVWTLHQREILQRQTLSLAA